MRFSYILLAAFLLFNTQSFAQEVPNDSPLSVAQIMQGDKFVGHLPSGIDWSLDGEWIYFYWNPEMDTLGNLYKVNIAGGTPEKVSDEEIMELPERGDFNDDRSKMVFDKGGDLYLMDYKNGETLRFTNTLDGEYSPNFSSEESIITFQKDNNIYTWDEETGTISQLTNLVDDDKKRKKSKPEYEQWLENDQMSWFDILQERKAKNELRKARREARKPKLPSPFYYGDKSLSNLKISPNRKFVTFQLTKRVRPKSTEVPDFVTASGFVDQRRARSKVGAPQSTYEFGILDLERDTGYIVDIKQIEGIFDKPAFLEEYHKDTSEYKDQYEKPRSVIIHGPFFSETGNAVVDIRSMDNKDRWLMLLDPATGDLKLLDRQHDDAWIGGPGISSWNFVSGNMGWLADGKTLWFQSEASGYSHLYTLDVETQKKKQLTTGNFEIIDADLSIDKTHFYITSNKETPFEHHFYKMSVQGGEMVKITTKSGSHQVSLSPDEKWLAIRYSYSNKPWELYLMKNEPGAEMKQITHSTTKAFENYDWRAPSTVWFEARDGVKVPARLYTPSADKKNGAAVIFVHGAGYLQNVHHWWSSYYREYMFHNLLTDNGYTVLDIDYRASNGYGRDWRTGIYRFMGGKDLEDNVDGAKYLVETHKIDADRIGIYGGSYGGFITLMGMFTTPGVFKSGAALRSVTDWAHYNHGYTSNILNTPVADSIAYYKSSPIYHADGLKDNLLILHGMVDTNVQFQDVVRLAQRLIELGKENWEFAVFPMEGHGFQESTSWTDEYKRIFKLFQDTLRE